MPLGLQIALTVAIGVIGGVLSGMFGLGGAVITTPAIRALGATAFEAIGSTLPSVLPSSISGSLRYGRENLIRRRIVLIVSASDCVCAGRTEFWSPTSVSSVALNFAAMPFVGSVNSFWSDAGSLANAL